MPPKKPITRKAHNNQSKTVNGFISILYLAEAIALANVFLNNTAALRCTINCDRCPKLSRLRVLTGSANETSSFKCPVVFVNRPPLVRFAPLRACDAGRCHKPYTTPLDVFTLPKNTSFLFMYFLIAFLGKLPYWFDTALIGTKSAGLAPRYCLPPYSNGSIYFAAIGLIYTVAVGLPFLAVNRTGFVGDFLFKLGHLT